MTEPVRPAAALALAEKSAPRYTSYPTAPHFSAAVDATVAEGWLAALAPDATLSLYLHVPYCSSICTYCGCHTKAIRRQEPLDEYTDALLAEIDALSRRSPARDVRHIHWGGGTPSMLGPTRFLRLATAIAERFDLSRIQEHAIELDPRTVDQPLVEALAKGGVTRASLGVQDLSLHVQLAIGRLQPYDIVARAVELLRGAGIAAINLDLMYGLPHQSLADVKETARKAAALDPSRLAIFGYAHVPWFKTHQRLIDASALPGAAERIAQAKAALDTLVEAGYVAIGLDHFAKPDDPMAIAQAEGRLRRNFQGYTVDDADALLGLGASSIGRLPQGFVQNAPDVGGWSRAVEAGRMAVVRGIELTDEDRARGELIERLMCDFRVDYGARAADLTGDAAAFDDALADLDALARDHVLNHDRAARVVVMTEAGRPFVRLAAAAFDARLRASATARHSVAV
ncbi:MAG: oxygen-independent coproporphyrinogen III oxidase [Methylobacteriaceae bacterium]|nr:oxygen-independent coproporphyrinogen III oxidase [Methylobacteriaceae bacterium]